MNILIVGDIHSFLKNKLELLGCKVVLNNDINFVRQNIHTFQGLIIRSLFVDQALLDNAKELKFIARAGSGLDNIDVDYANRKGIKVLSSPEANSLAVAEHALGMLLSLLNKIIISFNQVKQGKWERDLNWGTTLAGKVIGIIGYGNTGKSFANLLKGFNVKVIAYDKYKFDFGNLLVEEVTLDYIYEHCDILSIHLPLTDETKYWFNDNRVNKFKKPIILMNTSRGAIVNTNTLINALESKKVLGACLDVIEYEEKSYDNIHVHELFTKLLHMNNVVITPHIAGWTNESYELHSKILFDKIQKLFFSQNSIVD